MSIALLLAASAAAAAAVAACLAARGVRRRIDALRAELAALGHTAPAPRRAPAEEAREDMREGVREDMREEIRAAVTQALAEERERELAEARAFWAAQEARDAADATSLLSGLTGCGEDGPGLLPRQPDPAGLESSPVADSVTGAELFEGDEGDTSAEIEEPAGPAELAAARRRHPSHPDFASHAAAGVHHERTIALLAELAEDGIPLVDVRPGPLGTLDVYVFADGTTVCMTPGHKETAEALSAALREGATPILLGGSAVSGAYALTFSCGHDSVFVLADRVIASL
ncbi:hypothetical protein [Streptomyces zingiberis]|uniref:Secreted protein n=1 Tax=Streptomyces zingiberis TaxID=2053010 RepID=A0ABX1BYP0_9ACTN|nr:hypothetical protein [Streptomyces zingiberis]NJQ02751.1 hypothetical protein [Streptomyces zingiberis]